MTAQTYEGATAEQLNHPLVRHFLSIHDMFRTELQRILRYSDDLLNGKQSLGGAEAKARVQAIIFSGSRYTQYLHFHHHAESSSLFPALRDEGLDDAIIGKLEADHDEIAALIDQFNAVVANYAAIEPEVINSDLRRLSDALKAHLAYEESHVCPLFTRWDRWPNEH